MKTVCSQGRLKQSKSLWCWRMMMCSYWRLKQERKCAKPSIPNGFDSHVFCSYVGHCFCLQLDYLNDQPEIFALVVSKMQITFHAFFYCFVRLHWSFHIWSAFLNYGRRFLSTCSEKTCSVSALVLLISTLLAVQNILKNPSYLQQFDRSFMLDYLKTSKNLWKFGNITAQSGKSSLQSFT